MSLPSIPRAFFPVVHQFGLTQYRPASRAPSRQDPRRIALFSSVRNHNYKEASVTNARVNSHLPILGSGYQIGPFTSSSLAFEASQVATNTATPTSTEAAVPTINDSLSPLHNINQSPANVNMPAYRTGGRRQNRTGYVDHDILEGIPVRQWRREFVTVAPQPPQENNASQSDIWASELPWGMPKDSNLLPQHSQDLLRAARSGRIYKRSAPMDEEDQDLEVTPDKPDKKEDETKDSGFTARAWKQIPGHQNASDMDFLAKRRKGLASAVPKPHPVPTVVQTTVRRTDAAGNEYLEKVIVPHGQTVVGEVVSQKTIPDPSAVEGTPFRRKGPMGKKGKRGPGRGRKKIMNNSTPHITSEPAAQNGHAAASNLGADGIKIEGEGTKPAKNLDTEMLDDSNPASDDDDGDEGDQGDEDDDSLDVLNSPSRSHRDSFQDHPMSNMHDIPKLSSPDIVMGGTDTDGPTKLELERVKDEGKFGSPLKQIALTTSTVNTPTVSPTETTAQEPMYSAPENTNISSASIERINEEMLSVADVSAPTELPPVPPHPTREHEEVSTAVRGEEEEEEEMLLDNLENAQVGAGKSVRTESSTPAVPPPTQSPTKTLDTLPVEEASPQNITVPAVEEPPTIPNLATALSSPLIREEEQRVALISSASPVETDEQPTAPTSPTAAEHKSAEPGASTKPAEQTTTPTESSELNEHLAITESNELTGHIAPTNSNEPGEPRAESSNPTIDDDDDDDDGEFPDLLGGLERNLYGNSQPPAAPPASALAPAPAQSKSTEETKPSSTDGEGDVKSEEREKHEEA